ncbi:MAG: FAD-binding protein [Muribaculaceae bacterium]|nr:FAD-binding protein [Muribaculaceae bacterium]
MIRINQIKMPLSHTKEELLKEAAGMLHIRLEKILSYTIVKKSIDARKKPDIYFVYTLDVSVSGEQQLLRRGNRNLCKTPENPYRFPEPGSLSLPERPVIIGTGPAGLFCGYLLALHGYRPILLERGKAVTERKRDVDTFWEQGILKEDSNVQFGEGGAGAFSDGKLNTLVKDKQGRNREVLRILAKHGAPEEILYDAKPHIGTDILINVVQNMREEIIAFGGEVRFESKVTGLVTEDGEMRAVIINHEERLPAHIVVLAIGHSARDTFRMLYEEHVPMDAKAFAVGLRVEHPRQMIDKLQYGIAEHPLLPAASYKVTAQTGDKRGVYSFCMCPGGYVVNASSEPNKLAINGMSYSGRNGANSNSAVIITVTPKDFANSHPLAGVAFQRELEERAYRIGQGQVPVEPYGAFREALTGQQQTSSRLLTDYPGFMPAIKGGWQFAPVHEILPVHLGRAFIEGMDHFGEILPGFADSGVYVEGVESRTSSPVKIHRDETGQSSIKRLYPCGEGAGYAGGITSAAMDGMLIAEKIAGNYKPADDR